MPFSKVRSPEDSRQAAVEALNDNCMLSGYSREVIIAVSEQIVLLIARLSGLEATLELIMQSHDERALRNDCHEYEAERIADRGAAMRSKLAELEDEVEAFRELLR